jgi:glutaredoxin
MNELKIISLNNCPYSMAAEELIKTFKNIKDNKINVNILNVTQEDKSKYKSSEIETFPQIYFNNILIGGYDNFNEIYLDIKGIKNLDKMIKIIQNKTSVHNRKDMLRLIKFLIN